MSANQKRPKREVFGARAAHVMAQPSKQIVRKATLQTQRIKKSGPNPSPVIGGAQSGIAIAGIG